MKKILSGLMLDLLYKLIVIFLVGDFLLSGAAYFGRWHWLCELTSHFRMQYLALALLCVAGCYCCRARRWMIAGLVCMLLNALVIVPWYLPRSLTEVRPHEHNLRVLLCNVLWSNKNFAALLDLVRAEKPDVFVLQEVSKDMMAALKPLGSEYPFQRTVWEHDGRIACFSRGELEDFDSSIASGDPHQRIVTKLKINGRRVSLLTIHPPPPVSNKDLKERNRQMSEAAAIARQLPPPTIIIGDLNASLWTPYFTEMLRESGLAETRKGFGVLPTWPNFLPTLKKPLGLNLVPLAKIPIDHCLVSPDIKVVNCWTGRDVGSDHLPLIVDLFIQ